MSRSEPPPPVVDTNPPRRPRPEPAPPTAPPTPAPVPEHAPAAAPPAVSSTPSQGDMLASLLASSSGQAGPEAGPAGNAASMLVNMAAMRSRTVDPMADYVGDGTRKLRFIKEALHHYASLTGRAVQEVETSIMLGGDRIPDDLLDAHYLNLYKTDRPR